MEAAGKPPSQTAKWGRRSLGPSICSRAPPAKVSQASPGYLGITFGGEAPTHLPTPRDPSGWVWSAGSRTFENYEAGGIIQIGCDLCVLDDEHDSLKGTE